MKLETEIYIAASKEAKELYQKDLPKKGFFNCEAFTFDELLKNISLNSIDDLISRVYFKEAIKSLFIEFKHFKFNKENLYEDSIDLIFDFYIKIKLNSLKLEEFVLDDKKDDIRKIFKKYEELKKEFNIVDRTDSLLAISQKEIKDILKQYDSIIVDWQFYEENISFIRSKKELEIFKWIDSFKHFSKTKTRQRKQSLEYSKNITLNEAFDFSDEAKEAVKIVKTLLLNTDTKLSDIVIVASKMDKYEHSLRYALDEYSLKGYISTGIPFPKSGVYYELRDLKTPQEFTHFFKLAEKKLNDLPRNLKNNYAKTVNVGLQIAKKSMHLQQSLKSYNLMVDFKEIFEDLASKTSIELNSRKDAVLITEHNQVLKTKYKHIIYLGIDSIQLPQKFNDNFLYSSEDCEKLFISNYYKDALYIYDRLKRNAQNLYLITAKYLNKRELQISSVITDAIKSKLNKFEINSSIKSLNDILDEQKQTKIDETTKDYIISKQLKSQDKYNGVLNLNDEKSITFSASRLNEYSDCPLKYYFNYILKVKSPTDFDNNQFSNTEPGTLFHKVVEEFSKEYKQNKNIDVDICIDNLYDIYYKKSLPIINGEIYETVLHKIKKVELQVAINRFKQYVKDGNLDDFECAEEKFEFEMDGNNFTGIIDRIDINEENNNISLIDYKTSKAEKNSGSKDKKYEKLKEYKEFQLPLYHFFTEQDERYKKYKNGESYLLTFMGDTKQTEYAKFGQTNSSLTENDEENKLFSFNKSVKEEYKNIIKNIAIGINSGNFYNTACEDSCQYCSYISMCGNGIKVEKNF